jgi:hypothetical protein
MKLLYDQRVLTLDGNSVQQKSKTKSAPPFLGFSTAAILWWWGLLFMYSPTYLNITGVVSTILTIIGFVFLTISLAGAVVEVGKYLKNDGVNYFGGATLFMLPAIGLHAWDVSSILPSFISVSIRIVAIILMALGGSLLLQGIPYALWKKPSDVETTDTLQSEQKAENRRMNMELLANMIVAILSVTTAMISFANKMLP